MLAVQQPSSSNAEPSLAAPAGLAAVAAVVTIAQAVPTIEKRLSRVRDVETELGPMPRLVAYAYVRVQQLYLVALVILTIGGFGIVGAFFFPDAHPSFAWLREHGWLLVVLWVAIGAAMYTNLLSRCLLWFGPAATFLADQPLNQNPSWYAFASLVQQNENAKPLVVKDRAARSFADFLLRMLQTEALPSDRAVPPAQPATMTVGTFRSRIGNALLAGCVIEQAHYDLDGFPRRAWTPFYDVVGDLATTTELFAVENVIRDANIQIAIVDRINGGLGSVGKPPIPDSAELKDRLRRGFARLADQYGGNSAMLNSGTPWSNGRKLETVERRLRTFPGLENESIRAQFLKLAVVWNVWADVPLISFRYPLSKQIAAVLMDRDVIGATKDDNSFTYDEHSRERQVYQAAVKAVITHAIRLVEADLSAHRAWLPPRSAGTTSEVFKWWVAYELDFRLWAYARRIQSDAKRWRYDSGRVVRVA